MPAVAGCLIHHSTTMAGFHQLARAARAGMTYRSPFVLYLTLRDA